MRPLAALLAIPLVAGSLAAQARGVVSGTVRDAATGTALGGVRVEGAGAAAATSDSGTFALALPAGPVLLTLRRLGYAARAVEVRVPAGDTARIEVRLERIAQALDTVAVTSNAAAASPRLAEFERRRESGRGTFILREEIERRRPLRVSDLLRRVPSVTIMDSLGVRLAVSARGRKVVMNRRGVDPQAPCIMRIGVDGQVKEWGFSMDMVSPDEIHGIEIYSGPASIPSEFGGARTDAYCGLVMIWTRAR